MSVSTEPEPTSKDARKSVWRQKNSHVNPAVSTGEVASELGVSVEEAFELLQEDMANIGHLSNKTVAGSDPENHIWW